MALNKKAKSSLLVATIVAGISMAGADKIHTIQEIENLKISVEQRNSQLDEQKKDNIKIKKELEKAQNKLEDTEKDLKKTKKQLKKAKSQLSAYNASSSTRSVGKGTPVTITLTFYGDGADENGGYTGITALGKKLQAGMVASNFYSFGTKFEYGGQVYTVSDRGGSGFDGPNNLDVFVPRNPGESKQSYDARISKYGRKTVTMYKQ